MTPRRKETTLPVDEAPVRFYKFVALTFLIVAMVLLALIVFMSSKRTSIEITTKESPVDVTLSMSLGQNAEVAGVVAMQTVTTTATFEPTGDEQVPGIARGMITIVNDSNTAQPLVATTRFLSPDEILFRLEDGVTVPANGEVEAEVYADVEGKTGDVGPTDFTIPGLNATRQTQVYGKTNESMTGGLRTVGVLSDADIKRAEDQLLADAVEAFTTSFAAATGTSEVLVDVVNIKSESDTEVGTETSSFELTAYAELVGVTYDQAQVISFANTSLRQREIDDTEIITPSANNPTITFSSFDAEDNIVTASVFHSGMAMLNPESKQIEKMMFFGKTKDEVRRYLLSLDHVHSVNVKFKPAWIRSVPHVEDQVNVIVREVK
jgi:hypothetical protein